MEVYIVIRSINEIANIQALNLQNEYDHELLVIDEGNEKIRTGTICTRPEWGRALSKHI